jgi:hypothetical protein
MPGAAVLMLLAGYAQPMPQEKPKDDGAHRAAGASSGGIRTDRLKPGHLKLWRAVERIAMAADHEGRPVRPTLHSLWQWAGSSPRPIYVEMTDHSDAEQCSAAEFLIEDPGREPEEWTAVIRLNLRVIEAASARRWFDGHSCQVSLAGLGREERCAGLAGHELMHAYLAFEDADYARLLRDYKREAMAYYLDRKTRSAAVSTRDPEFRSRLERLQSMMERLEAPTGVIEMDLWHELMPLPLPGGDQGAPLPAVKGNKAPVR